ncbi:methyltransferase domain-containing protein [Bradyrhizobium sp.]|uniref:methyltransferase domain-containing protein n=1 Tax=Bradyrhizobium sp. TaxID=376 RepID=UPI003C7357C6
MNQQGQWQVAGSAPEVYERELVPAVFGAWAPILVELAEPRPSERVLDVACGTGVVARIAATRVGPTGTVVGIDLNPGMLSLARSLVSRDSRSGGQLQWQEASADKLPFPDGSFNVVYCQLGLQFFADRPAALREMRRVLGTEGRLAAICVELRCGLAVGWSGITGRRCGARSSNHRRQERLGKIHEQ